MPADPAPRALRLSLALEAGLSMPDGDVALLHPGLAEVLPPLPGHRIIAVSPMVQVHAWLAAQGLTAATDDPPPGSMGAALVCLPRGRVEAQDLIARACAITRGPVIVDGQKSDGSEAMVRALRDRVALSGPISKGHGKIVWFPATPMEDWRAAPRQVVEPDGTGFVTRPGVFSADGVDPASDLLAQALPAGLRGVAADLGAGWGYLAAQLLRKAPAITALHLIEADARALDCARQNVTDPRARFHWADATRPPAGIRADLVVMNPPFHHGRTAQPGLGAAFIAAAGAMLNPGGALWMVANRHLPYEEPLNAAFRVVEDVGGTSKFKLFRATRPNAAAPARPSIRAASRR